MPERFGAKLSCGLALIVTTTVALADGAVGVVTEVTVARIGFAPAKALAGELISTSNVQLLPGVRLLALIHAGGDPTIAVLQPIWALGKLKLGGVNVNLVGIAKGAGMIAPDMATMLSYVFTDAPIAASALQAMLSSGVKTSFNAITVDSDTSTSDTLLVFATQAAAKRGAPRIEEAGDRRLVAFKQAFASLLLELSHLVVRDGEGARKFVAVTVEGAVSNASAKRIALSIANSPLVKTAIAGEDANWGRVVMAVGKAGEPADRDKLDIFFGDIRVATGGARDPAYSEAATTSYMQGQDLAIRVSMGLGKGRATVWTCDLTKAYVEINGDYRS